MYKRLLVIISLLLVTNYSYWNSDSNSTITSYEEVECSTDVVFSQNSCNQCFNWWEKKQWDYLGLLSDLWLNVTNVAKIIYKEEQVDPQMINLDPNNVSWTQTTEADWFWEYTDEFNALYSDAEEWYVLAPGWTVTWIKTALSSAFKLDKNTALSGTNIGLLLYPIATHNILEDWEITVDSNVYNECVLFKSAEEWEEIIEEPKKLPETGPSEYLLLLFLAMILGFWILRFRTKS